MCGDKCINPLSQCCVSAWPRVGVNCGATGKFCTGDGAVCAAGCGALPTCGSSCYSPSTACCANGTLSMVGENINGGCVGGNSCGITYSFTDVKGGSANGTITGHKCTNNPLSGPLCQECCDNADCPGAAFGAKCVSGMCVHYGCTTFSCWNAQGRQVCKINPSNDGTAACAVSGKATTECMNKQAREMAEGQVLGAPAELCAASLHEGALNSFVLCLTASSPTPVCHPCFQCCRAVRPTLRSVVPLACAATRASVSRPPTRNTPATAPAAPTRSAAL